MRQRLTAYATICLLLATPGSASGEDTTGGGKDADISQACASKSPDELLALKLIVNKSVLRTYRENGIIIFNGFSVDPEKIPEGLDLGSVVRYLKNENYGNAFLTPLPGQEKPRLQVYSLHPRETGYALVFPGGRDIDIPNNTIPEAFCAGATVTNYEEGSFSLGMKAETDIVVVHPVGTVPEKIENSCNGGDVFYIPIDIPAEPKNIMSDLYNNIFFQSDNLWKVAHYERMIKDIELIEGECGKALITKEYEYYGRLNTANKLK